MRAVSARPAPRIRQRKKLEPQKRRRSRRKKAKARLSSTGPTRPAKRKLRGLCFWRVASDASERRFLRSRVGPVRDADAEWLAVAGIVPFEAQQRIAGDRANDLEILGVRRCAGPRDSRGI